jgi:hypothetical protein
MKAWASLIALLNAMVALMIALMLLGCGTAVVVGVLRTFGVL